MSQQISRYNHFNKSTLEDFILILFLKVIILINMRTVLKTPMVKAIKLSSWDDVG
jgi:hypothetical protein